MLDRRVPNVHVEGNRRESNINQAQQSENRRKPNQPLQRQDRRKGETELLRTTLSRGRKGEEDDGGTAGEHTCPFTLRLMWAPPSAGFLSSSPAPDIVVEGYETRHGLDSRKGPAISGRSIGRWRPERVGGGVAMRRRTWGLIGRLPVTGFDTRLASGSSLRGTLWPACTWPRPRARLFGIRIGCGRARPPLRGPVRCVGCTPTGSRARVGPAAACTGVRRAELSGCVFSPCVRTERTGAGWWARGVGAVRANGLVRRVLYVVRPNGRVWSGVGDDALAR
jgi:hypothetical protein